MKWYYWIVVAGIVLMALYYVGKKLLGTLIIPFSVAGGLGIYNEGTGTSYIKNSMTPGNADVTVQYGMIQ